MQHAGTFYPECPTTAKAVATNIVNQGRDSFGLPLAIVAPHAGWQYCGPVMGTAFKAAAKRKNVTRIIHLGPSHYHPITGIYRDPTPQYETPLGLVEIEHSEIPGLAADQSVHAVEHALEVQLPFIRLLFPEACLLPFIVGTITPSELSAILNDLGSGESNTLTIISSDLSHYLAKEDASQLDRSTLAVIDQLDEETLKTEQACGAAALSGLLHLARDRKWTAATLDRRDTHDIMGGDPNSVVGYGAIAFYGEDKFGESNLKKSAINQEIVNV